MTPEQVAPEYVEQENRRWMQQRDLEEMRANAALKQQNENSARKAWEDRQLMDSLIEQAQQAGRVDDQMKRIQQAQKFIAARRLQADIDAGVPFAQAARGNLAAFSGTAGGWNPSVANIFKTQGLQPNLPIAPTALHDPETGELLGYTVPTGPNSSTVIRRERKTAAGEWKDRYKVADLFKRQTALEKRISENSFSVMPAEQQRSVYQQLSRVRDELDKYLAPEAPAEAAPPPSGAPAATAPPPGADIGALLLKAFEERRKAKAP